jgi:hypothetical protein
MMPIGIMPGHDNGTLGPDGAAMAREQGKDQKQERGPHYFHLDFRATFQDMGIDIENST